MAEVVNGVSIQSMSNEEELYKLLDETEDFDERKKIRARLRQVQTEQRAKRDEMLKKREQEREDMVLTRKREAEEQKRRTLAMYDQMAKNKVMDISIYKNDGSAPHPIPMQGSRDLVEEGIKKRQKEAEDRKKQLLAAYDAAARSGQAGPKSPDFDAAEKMKSAPPTKPTKPSDCTMGTIVPPKNNQVSAKAKFQQMDAVQNKPGGAVRPNFRAGGGVTRSASDIKDMLLSWCKSKTKEYKEVEITNFSTSWNDGMAFCALIHHFYPDAFDFQKLNPKNRRHNFELAFRTAEEKADIAPLLDVEDMVVMKKPDWKCVFTYVQSFYRKLYNAE